MGVMKKMKSFASVMAITLLLLAIFCNNLASAEFKLGRTLSQVYGSPGGYMYSPPTYGGPSPPGQGYRPPTYGGPPRGGYGPPGGCGPPGYGGYSPPPPSYGGYRPPGYGGYRPPYSPSKP